MTSPDSVPMITYETKVGARMLQVIGLIVAVYAMIRVIQIPIEMTATQDQWLGLPFNVRLFILAGISGLGLLILGVLTLMLLFSGSTGPPGF